MIETRLAAIPVMWAETVDPAVRGIKAELAQLEEDLGSLHREADLLEAAVRDAQRSAADDDRAVALVDRVLAGIVANARADLDRALEQAKTSAERDLSSTRTAAGEIVADLTSVLGPTPPGPAVPRPWWALTGEDVTSVAASPPAATRPGGSASSRPPVEPPRSAAASAGIPLAHDLGDLAFAPPSPAPAGQWSFPPPLTSPARPTAANAVPEPVPPTPVGPPIAPLPAAPAGAPPAAPAAPPQDHPPAAAVAADVVADGKFRRFWHQDVFPAPEKTVRFNILDAVLPVIALAITLVVVLSWVG